MTQSSIDTEIFLFVLTEFSLISMIAENLNNENS